MANLGLLGFALWLVIIGIAFRNLFIAQSILGSGKYARRFLLVQAVTYDLLLQVAYGLTANVHLDKFIWLLLGLSVAVRSLVAQRGQQDASISMSNVSVQIQRRASTLD